jgi:proline iminopeptidase
LIALFAPLLFLGLHSCGTEPNAVQTAAEEVQTEPGPRAAGTLQAGKYGLRYRIEGAGTPTLVIGSSIYYPRVFSQNLRSHLKLVFLDHRGFCPPPDEAGDPAIEFALDKLLDDCELARKKLDLGKIIVVGHSGHSFMALEYAKKYPENVSHVVMIGIGPDISDSTREITERNWQENASAERKRIMEEKLIGLPDEELAKLSPEEAYMQTYIRNSPRIWFDAGFDCSPFWEGMDLNIEMLNYVWGVLFRDIDITKGLGSLDRPVFLALGRYDFLVPPPTVWDPLQSQFQDLTIRVFEKSGHTPQYEEAELFDREMLAWIQEKSKDN